MKKTISILAALLLVIGLLPGSAGADTYKGIIDQEEIVLDSSWKDNPNPNITEGWFIWHKKDNKTVEGEFLIAKASQFLYLTPLFSDREELRFYEDVIYTGDGVNCYRDSYGLSSFLASSGHTLKYGYGLMINSWFGADVITANGGLFDASILKQEWQAKTYADLYKWIAETGEEYHLGYYDTELADKGFLLCVFTDGTIKDEKWNVSDMLLGQWSNSSAYNTVFLNEAGDLYQTASKAYSELKHKKTLSYAHAMGLPTELILGKETVRVLSDDERAEMSFSPDGGFSYKKRRDEKTGSWAFSDGRLMLSFADGRVAVSDGDPVVLAIDDSTFTLRIRIAGLEAEENADPFITPDPDSMVFEEDP